MLFNSYEFIFIFLPITLLIYIVLGKFGSRRTSLVWLIAASLFFYSWWNPAYLGLILGSMFFNYSIGTLLSSDKAANSKKPILILGISTNLLLLAYYKYANFFIDNVNAIFNVDWNLEYIILPLAISFFTFQQIAYLVDTYRSETREYNFLQYALFVSFFPQLIAGPIVHHREIMPQFLKIEIFEVKYKYFAVGLSIFFLGLFKKVVLADSLSPYVEETFSAVSSGVMLSFFEAWHGVLAFTFQLYFDFSGYSDMAVGLAYLFGVRLPLNFNSPYKAYNIIEFWKRWHITLSRFLKDYLYIPLGGNRKGTLKRYLNIMITMVIGGLWHGAGWAFIIWGALHGFYLIVNHSWISLKKLLPIPSFDNSLMRFIAQFVTFLAVAIAWVYFRADDFEAANLMISSLFGYGGVVWPEEARSQLGMFADIFSSWGMQFQYLKYFNGISHIAQVILFLLVVLVLPNVQQLFYNSPAVLGYVEPSKVCWQPNKKWAVFTVIIAVASILKLGQVSEFLYFQF